MKIYGISILSICKQLYNEKPFIYWFAYLFHYLIGSEMRRGVENFQMFLSTTPLTCFWECRSSYNCLISDWDMTSI